MSTARGGVAVAALTVRIISTRLNLEMIYFNF
jgi:hypothetical protein